MVNTRSGGYARCMSNDETPLPLSALRRGEDDAARVLWERFFERMVRFARARLGDGDRRDVDEEDVALSAFDSFCRAAREGRCEELDKPDGLWRLLLRMTERKCIDRHRHRTRLKRGGGNVRGESVFGGPGQGGGIGDVVDLEPTAESEALCAVQLRSRLDGLKPEHREVAIARLEGDGIAEIAERLGVAQRTVERRLEYIRAKWAKDLRR